MAYKVCLSYGHGSNTWEKTHSKAVIVDGKVYEEHTHNATVGEKVKTILMAHGINVLVLQSPFELDVPLKTRTDRANAWGADLYYSIHANAAAPSVKGYTAFYWSTSVQGKRIADLYAEFAREAGFPLYHNGVFPSVSGTWNDFHELRETKMNALLTENGFMTNSEDFRRVFLNENDSFNKEARVHAKTILAYFAVQYDPVKSGETPAAAKPSAPVSGTIYRVQVGAFGNRENAERLAARLKAAGFANFINKEGKFYKVQAGAFKDISNARDLVDKLEHAGYQPAILKD